MREKLSQFIFGLLLWPALLAKTPEGAFIGCIIGIIFWFGVLCAGIGFGVAWLAFR